MLLHQEGERAVGREGDDRDRHGDQSIQGTEEMEAKGEKRSRAKVLRRVAKEGCPRDEDFRRRMCRRLR